MRGFIEGLVYVTELREGNPVEVLRNRDTVDFLQRRADALACRCPPVGPPQNSFAGVARNLPRKFAVIF